MLFLIQQSTHILVFIIRQRHLNLPVLHPKQWDLRALVGCIRIPSCRSFFHIYSELSNVEKSFASVPKFFFSRFHLFQLWIPTLQTTPCAFMFYLLSYRVLVLTLSLCYLSVAKHIFTIWSNQCIFGLLMSNSRYLMSHFFMWISWGMCLFFQVRSLPIERGFWSE